MGMKKIIRVRDVMKTDLDIVDGMLTVDRRGEIDEISGNTHPDRKQTA